MAIEFGSGVPIYQQLAQTIKEQIAAGIYKPGDAIPPEEELCRLYDISRVTVRKAVTLLVEEGLVIRRQGLGTFVTKSRFVESTHAHGSFTLSCLQNNVNPATKIVSCRELVPTEEIAEGLNLKAGETVICIKRVRYADDIPVMFETDYLPADRHRYLLEIDMENRSLLDTIKQNSGLFSSGYEDVVDIRYAEKEHAEWLKCKKAAPLLGVYQMVYHRNNEVLYINDQVIDSENYKYISVHHRRD